MAIEIAITIKHLQFQVNFLSSPQDLDIYWNAIFYLQIHFLSHPSRCRHFQTLPHTVSHVVGIADPIIISPGFHSMLKNGSRKCNHRSAGIFQVQPEVIYWKKRPSANSAIIQQDVVPFRSPLLIPEGWWQTVGYNCDSAVNQLP